MKKPHCCLVRNLPIAIVGILLCPDELCIVIVLQTGGKVFENTECQSHCGKVKYLIS